MSKSSFSAEEAIRYSRHFVLPGFGEAAQQKLKKANVLVVGAGGLGAPALYYLAAAGVGKLAVADADTINLSNLQRQILFTAADVGQGKAAVAVNRLRALNAEIQLTPIPLRIDRHNALEILQPYDVVVDATDNFATRYLLNDACVLLGKPLVYGSVFRYEGQVAVFNFQGSANYRDLYPEPPAPGSVPDCEQGGVIGVLPGLIGCYQANEVIKLITGTGESLRNKLMLVDTLTLETNVLNIPNRNQKDRIKSLIDYEQFCGLKPTHTTMKEVTVQELKNMMDQKEDFQLIDVREPHEYDICNLEGELIPQAEIPHSVDRIAKDKKVVIHCRSGARSGNMVNWLEKNHGFTNLYNLKGGILAWADQIDTSMPKY